MSHAYIEFCYHLVRGPKLRHPYITPEIEGILHGYIRKRCEEMGVFVYALNGMPDHQHLVCSISPRLSVGEVMEKVKGASAHYINHLPDRDATLYWQEGYGGLTFAKRNLAKVVRYMENQKAHHAERTLWPPLEKLDSPRRAGQSQPGSPGR